MLIIKLIRYGRREYYKLEISKFDSELVGKIKQIPSNERSWDAITKEWSMTALGVFSLINLYKGRNNDIKFEFEDDKQRGQFLNIIKKHRSRLEKDHARITTLSNHNNDIIEYKENLSDIIKGFDYGAYLKPNVIPMEHQIKSAHFAKKLLEEDYSCLFAMDMGTGKAQPLSSKILTPNGYVTMGEIKVGDNVISSKGKATKVLNIFPQGEKDVFRITFSDGSSTLCCNEHLWNIKVDESNWKTLSLGELIDNDDFNIYDNQVEIPITLPVEFNNYEYDVSLYTLSTFLNCSPLEIGEETKELLNNYGLLGIDVKDYFIPNVYKLGSISDRYELLSELLSRPDLEYDGYSSSYHHESLLLLEDIKFIIESLGGVATINEYNIDITLSGTINYVDTRRFISSIEKVDKMECQCILIDDESHLYLTDDCIVTHNTLSSILAMEMMPELKKILFIVPANLRLNIQNEIHTFTNSYCFVPVVSKNKKGEYYFTKYKRNIKPYEECRYVVLSYDYFSLSNFDPNKKILNLGLHEIDCIVFDEMHYITNKKANRTENINRAYGKIVKKYLGLSATPLKGNLKNFFPILKTLKPEEFSNENKFLDVYGGMKFFHKDGDFRPALHQVNEPNLALLNEHLQTMMYRVKKSEVLTDLEPLVRNKIIIEMTASEKSEYNKIEEGFARVNWNDGSLLMNDEVETSPLAIMIRLRQYLGMLKTKKALELMLEMNQYGEKTIFFDAFKDPVKFITNYMGDRTASYTGDNTMEEKQDIVDSFQKENKYDNICATISSASVGITLTKASNVIMNTLALTPDENEQCISRAHRKGQENKVFVYTLLVGDTIDEDIYETLSKKQALFDAVIDGNEYVDTSEDATLNDIFAILKEKYYK